LSFGRYRSGLNQSWLKGWTRNFLPYRLQKRIKFGVSALWHKCIEINIYSGRSLQLSHIDNICAFCLLFFLPRLVTVLFHPTLISMIEEIHESEKVQIQKLEVNCQYILA
jgi:hypothetical protein